VNLKNVDTYRKIDRFIRKEKKDIFFKKLDIVKVEMQVVAGYNYKIVYQSEDKKLKYEVFVYEGIDR
jgi:hypothetical protein